MWGFFVFILSWKSNKLLLSARLFSDWFSRTKKKFWRQNHSIPSTASYPLCSYNCKLEYKIIIYKISEGFAWLIVICNDSFIFFLLQWWDVWEFQAVLSQASVSLAQLRIPLVSMRFLTLLVKTCVAKTSYGKYEKYKALLPFKKFKW